MLLKTLLLTFLVHTHPCSDSVPSLLSFHQEDIDTVTAAYKPKTITVKLKTGESYTYGEDQWSRVTMKPLPRSIGHAIFVIDATFTKVEVPPSFPGGPAGWDAYLQKVCSDPRNQRLIKRKGPAIVEVQFIVAFDGQVDQVHAITTVDTPQKLIDLAVRIIKEGPAWVPANQNGHAVTAYHKQRVDLHI